MLTCILKKIKFPIIGLTNKKDNRVRQFKADVVMSNMRINITVTKY